MTKNHDQNISRRRFLRYGLEAGITVSFVGGLHSLSQAKAYVRPPGSIIADDFTSRCMRCSICVEVCPTRAIRLTDLSWDIKNISTPVIDTRFGGCTHWKEPCLKCADACPTGALDKTLARNNSQLGEVSFEKKACVNCMVCLDRCPIEGAVLFPNPDGAPYTRTRDIPAGLRLVNSEFKPYINPEKCSGCGLCAHYCPEKIMFLQPTGQSA